jgi:hypothetical protein
LLQDYFPAVAIWLKLRSYCSVVHTYMSTNTHSNIEICMLTNTHTIQWQFYQCSFLKSGKWWGWASEGRKERRERRDNKPIKYITKPKDVYREALWSCNSSDGQWIEFIKSQTLIISMKENEKEKHKKTSWDEYEGGRQSETACLQLGSLFKPTQRGLVKGGLINPRGISHRSRCQAFCHDEWLIQLKVSQGNKLKNICSGREQWHC